MSGQKKKQKIEVMGFEPLNLRTWCLKPPINPHVLLCCLYCNDFSISIYVCVCMRYLVCIRTGVGLEKFKSILDFTATVPAMFCVE